MPEPETRTSATPEPLTLQEYTGGVAFGAAFVHIGEMEFPKLIAPDPAVVVKCALAPARALVLHVNLVTFVAEIKPFRPVKLPLLLQVNVRFKVPSEI